MNALAPLFLIGSSSFLQVRRTAIKSWTSSKFDQIGPWTELAALERQEKSCEPSSTFFFFLIFFILAGNEDMLESLDEFKFRQI